MQIHDLTRQTPSTGGQLVFDTGSATYKALVSDVAKVIMEQYNGTSLAGSAQTPKAAIDGLNNNLTALAARFDGNSIQFVNMSTSSGSGNNAIRFVGTSASETTEHEYVMYGVASGNRMFGFYAYIRYSSQVITVYSFGDIECTGSISGDTAIIKVSNWMKGFGIVRNKVATMDYTNVS